MPQPTGFYQNLKRHVEAMKCPVCHGTGQCDDAEPGDMSYKSWTCTACNGTGCAVSKETLLMQIKEDINEFS